MLITQHFGRGSRRARSSRPTVTEIRPGYITLSHTHTKAEQNGHIRLSHTHTQIQRQNRMAYQTVKRIKRQTAEQRSGLRSQPSDRYSYLECIEQTTNQEGQTT